MSDQHIYNIINNPPKEFTEPCECCGVSEFQLGVKHAEQRIIKLLEKYAESECDDYCEFQCTCYGKHEAKEFIEKIKGEHK